MERPVLVQAQLRLVAVEHLHPLESLLVAVLELLLLVGLEPQLLVGLEPLLLEGLVKVAVDDSVNNRVARQVLEGEGELMCLYLFF